MPDEIVLSIALSYAKGGRSVNADDMGLTGLEIDVTGTDHVRLSQTIPTANTVINLGGITAPGYIVVKDKSAYSGSQYVQLKNGSSGAVVAQLHGGDACAFRVATGAVLYGIATSAEQELDILIIEA